MSRYNLLLFVLLGLLAVFSSGCTVIESDRCGRMYSGLPRPGTEISTIYWNGPMHLLELMDYNHAESVTCDNWSVVNCNGTKNLEVPPDIHHLSVTYQEFHGDGIFIVSSVQPRTIRLDCKAGSEYILTAKRVFREWNPIIREWTPGKDISVKDINVTISRLPMEIGVIGPIQLAMEKNTYTWSDGGLAEPLWIMTGRYHFNSRAITGLQNALPLVFKQVRAMPQVPASTSPVTPTIHLKPRFVRCTISKSRKEYFEAKVVYKLEMADTKNHRTATVSITGKDGYQSEERWGRYGEGTIEVYELGRDLCARRALQAAIDKAIAEMVGVAYRFASDSLKQPQLPAKVNSTKPNILSYWRSDEG